MTYCRDLNRKDAGEKEHKFNNFSRNTSDEAIAMAMAMLVRF